MSRNVIVSVTAISILLVLGAVFCVPSDPSRTLTKPEWSGIAVKYFVVSKDGHMIVRHWWTRDAGTLTNLRQSLSETQPKPLSLIPTLTTNCVRVELSSGRIIEMYVFSSDRVTWHMVDKPGQSYGASGAAQFISTLSAAIEADTGNVPRYYQRVGEAIEPPPSATRPRT